MPIRAGVDEGIGLDAEQVFRQKFARSEFRHMSQVKTAAKVIGRLPKPGESIRILMSGRFHGWDFVPAVLQLAAPVPIAELCVATLGFNDRNTGELLQLLDSGRIKRVYFLCSCYMRDSSSELYQPLADALARRGMKIKATRNHAKILAMKMADGRHFVVDGSMNLRSCRNVEQVNLTHDRGLYRFFARYIRQSVEDKEHVK